jgi:hypothetical protein|tara:strand:+ start:356 stop:1285 length:930 start_codon:yes stop_codon:yes gene_type:complete
MTRARFILAVLVSASFVSLVAAGSYGGGESDGFMDCGKSSTWTIAAGQTKVCCVSGGMNYVDKFEYTTEPVGSFSGSSDIKFTVRESLYSNTFGYTSDWTVADADCALDGSAGTCTGAACAVSGASSDGKCNKEVDIDSHDKEDICVVANCTGSSTCTHKVEITFTHNNWECDDPISCGPAPPPTDNEACHCVAETKMYGSCDGLAVQAKGKWCTEPGWDPLYDEFCCAASSDDCCESDGGAVAGLVIGIFAGITLCCVACCYCCKCCCWAPKATTVVHHHPGVMVAGQPGVVMQGQPVYTTTATVLPK